MDLPLALNELEKCLGRDTLLQQARVLNDSYNTFMYDREVWEMVASALGNGAGFIIEKLASSVSGHRFVSELLVRYCASERVMKYHLVKERVAVLDEVTIFEMRVDSSRLDVAMVNGESHAFEVKTEYDRLDKLAKQLADYGKVFEYLTVVAHTKHVPAVLKLVPEYCGVQTYSIVDGNAEFRVIRTAGRNHTIEPQAQVRNLSSRALGVMLNLVGVNAPEKKEERAALVLQELTPDIINEQFKTAVKEKFCRRWTHVRNNFSHIEPIDIQAFYHAEAEPCWVYYKTSSMVKR